MKWLNTFISKIGSSFRNKLIFFLSVFVTLAVLATGWTIFSQTRHIIKTEKNQKIDTLSHILDSLNNDLIISLLTEKDDSSYLSLTNKIESLSHNFPEINNIFIISPDKDQKKWKYILSVSGHAYNKFKPGEQFTDIDLSSAFGNKNNSDLKQIVKNDLTYVLIPVFNNKNDLVAVTGYTITADYLLNIDKSLRSPIFLSVIFIILLSILISYLISYQIEKPVQLLVSKIKKISEGHLFIEEDLHIDKEFIKLSEEINILAKHLDQKTYKNKELEEILKRDKEKFEFMIDSMSDGVFTVDNNMKITEFNKGAERITGFTREEALGSNCRDIFHRDLCERNCALMNVAKTGYEKINIESNIITKDNKVIPILSSSAPLKDETGDIIGGVESFRDITELKKMHESLETAKNQALSFSNILKEQNKELLETYTQLEETQNRTHEYLKKLENSNFLLDKNIIELSKLNEFSTALSSILDIEELLHKVIKSCVEQMDAESGSIMLIDNNNKELVARSAFGNYYYDIFNVRVKIGEGISGWVAKHGEALMVTNIEKDPRFKHIMRQRYESKSLISVPLKVKDKTIGVLNINHKKTKEVFGKDDLNFLLSIVSQASIAIENANLYEKLQRSYFETVHALTMAVEAKDGWTHGHSDRVIKYALDIGKAIGFSEWQLEKIRYAGALHDIGKIGISELIINKERFLTKEEYAIIKKHPVIGASIIEPIEFLNPIKLIIRHHHEHFDGNGYPDGLQGDSIQYEARILSVADAFDAMTSDRPYRRALSTHDAMLELKKHSGKQFDPKVVAIFEDIIIREKNEKIISS